MGDYSNVTLVLDSKVRAALEPQMKLLEIEPDYIHESGRFPTGAYKRPHMLVWEEARSGLENDSIRAILDWLQEQKLPYTALDDGCWGVWSEEEEVFNGRVCRSRPLRDGVPVLEYRTIEQATRGMGLADIGALVVDYFSDDPDKWP